MEKFQELRDEAKRKVKIADHLLTVTYPMVQDPKLLLTVLQNVFSCYENAMNAILEHQKLFKRLNVLPEAFEPRFQIFSSEVAPKLEMKKHASEMKEIQELLTCHKDSPVEFARKDSFVICSDNYNVKTVSADKIKEKVKNAKEFARVAEEVVKENERIFR